MTRLTDLQTILLSSAAQRADGSLLPPPDTISPDADRAGKAIAALIKRGYAEELSDVKSDHAWRTDGDLQFWAVLTNAGRIAIGVELDSAEPTLGSSEPMSNVGGTDTVRFTKAALVLSLLHREQDATLAELVEATGWLPHTTRAALTGIRKKGNASAKSRRDDVTCYTLVA